MFTTMLAETKFVSKVDCKNQAWAQKNATHQRPIILLQITSSSSKLRICYVLVSLICRRLN